MQMSYSEAFRQKSTPPTGLKSPTRPAAGLQEKTQLSRKVEREHTTQEALTERRERTRKYEKSKKS